MICAMPCGPLDEDDPVEKCEAEPWFSTHDHRARAHGPAHAQTFGLKRWLSQSLSAELDQVAQD